MRFVVGKAICCLSGGAAMLTVGVGGAAAFLTSSFAARASSSPWTGSRTQTAWRGGSRTSKVDVAVESSRVSTAAGTAPVVSEEALRLQEQLRKLCADKSEADRETRIEALAKDLNALNPTKDPAFSPLLAGKWRMLYSTVPGPSSGRLGPFVGDVFQDIRPDDKRIFNILEFGPSWALRGALEADVEILDGNNWAINFDVVYNTFAGIQVQEKKFDRAVMERRIWSMTYLDDGFRVLYGRQESMREEDGFIFVLERDRRQ